MLSAGDVTPTVKVNGDVTMTSSRGRSSASRDGGHEGSVNLARPDGSVAGSGSSLAPAGLAASASGWQRESIVEALEKRCRENVSSRLRSQLPQHLRNSSTSACSDLPVIARAATSTLSRPEAPARVARLSPASTLCPAAPAQVAGLSAVRGGEGLYRAVTGSLYDSAARRHSTTAAWSSERLTRSLSVQSRRGSDDSTKQASWMASSTLDRVSCDKGAAVSTLRLDSTAVFESVSPEERSCVINGHVDHEPASPLQHQTSDELRRRRRASGDVLDQPDNTSAWSLVQGHQNWAADKRATLPARLQAGDAAQPENRPGCGDWTGSSSSVDTDTTEDCEEDVVYSDSCDDVSVDSFTFSHHLAAAASSATLGRQAPVNAGSDARSEEVCSSSGDSSGMFSASARDSNVASTDRMLTAISDANASSTSFRDPELHSSKASAVNVALTHRALTTGPPVRTDNTLVTNKGSGGTTDIENAQINETEATCISPSTGRSTLNSDQPCNGELKMVDVSQTGLMSSKDAPMDDTKSVSKLEVARTEDRSPCDGGRYRTSISLTIASPPVSAPSTKLFYCSSTPAGQSAAKPSRRSTRSSCDQVSPSQRDLTVSRPSDSRDDDDHDEEDNDDQTSGQLAADTSRRLCSDDDVSGADSRSGASDNSSPGSRGAVTESVEINVSCSVTPAVTAATGKHACILALSSTRH